MCEIRSRSVGHYLFKISHRQNIKPEKLKHSRRRTIETETKTEIDESTEHNIQIVDRIQ